MSAVDDLTKKVQSLRSQLEDATRKRNQAMVDACEFKVGDEVEGIKTLGYRGDANGRREKVNGQVRNIYVNYDKLEIDIAAKTKSGYHARSCWSVDWNSPITKVAPPEEKGTR